MARQIVLLALIFIAVVGSVSAQAPAKAPSATPSSKLESVGSNTAPTATPSSSPADEATTSPPSPTPDSEIGAFSPSDDAGELSPSGDVGTEGPAGFETPDFGAPLSSSEGPATGPAGAKDKNSACALKVSGIAGVTAVAGFFFF